MKKITILGYYAKSNLGDDLFNVAFQGIADLHSDKLTVQFIEPTQKDIMIEDDCDAFVVGGGDIVTSYFEQTTYRLKHEYETRTGKRLPTYAVSIGLSFPENINDTRSTFLDLFDHIIFRNKTDTDMLLDRYGPQRVCYMPDLVFAIPRLLGFNAVVPKQDNGVLLVCLAQAMCADNTNPSYNHLVNKLTQVLDRVSEEWRIVFFNFNTNKRKKTECDDLLHREIQQRLRFKSVIIEETEAQRVWEVFQTVDRVFAMRFHAHVLAISTETPLVSLSMTNKTENLMIESGLEESMVRMSKPNRKTHYPVDFDSDKLLSLILDPKLKAPKSPEISDPIDYFSSPLKSLYSATAPEYLHPGRVETDVTRVATALSKSVCKFLDVEFDPEFHPEELKRLRTLGRFYYRISGGSNPDKQNEKLKNTLVALIEFNITGSDVTDFKYGLSEQLWSLEISDGVEWILHKLAITEGLPKNTEYKELEVVNATDDDEICDSGAANDYVFDIPTDVKMNMDYIPQQVSKGYHRSGWKYVMDNLRKAYHDPSAELIFDGYVDKTFHWSRDVSMELGLIPYAKPWIGVIHHTPDEKYTPYNTTRLVADPVFQNSLSLCKGLIVMSEYLKNWFRSQSVIPEDLPIYVLTHPTMFVEDTYSLDKFFTRQPKWGIVQIGGWLRDSYGIYGLQTNTSLIQKYALKGKGMENYFPVPSKSLSKILEDMICENGASSEEGCGGISEPPCGCISYDNGLFSNKYYMGLLKHVKQNEEEVSILERLSDEDYDSLLSESIVFLKLEDASACNTLIECIVRNTPILINRHPAVVEMLGEEYPLYYSNSREASFLATDCKSIVLAHLHIKKLDKRRFMVEAFLEDMGKVLAV